MKSKCDEMELLMADALGGELIGEETLRFEQHLASCESCRVEYESLSGTVSQLRSRLGSDVDILNADQPKQGRVEPSTRLRGTLLRYAAIIIISMGVGYGLRGESTSHRDSVPLANDAPAAKAATVQERFATVHRSSPGSSAFTKSLLAVFSTNGES